MFLEMSAKSGALIFAKKLHKLFNSSNPCSLVFALLFTKISDNSHLLVFLISRSFDHETIFLLNSKKIEKMEFIIITIITKKQ